MMVADGVAFGHGPRAFDGGAQLADVPPVPCTRRQQLQRLRGEALGHAFVAVGEVEQMLRDEGNVSPPVAQGGNA